MLRASRAVSTGKGHDKESGGMLDLHCGNRWHAGANASEIDVLEYAQHMSLMDSVMFGEGFDDGGTSACADRQSGSCGDADWMLLATSGLQFGVFNDMLADPNLFRGMVFGMWGRPPYTSVRQNKQLWAWMDASGLSENSTEMLGYFADEPDWYSVVESSVPDIKTTAYLVQPNASRTSTSGIRSGQVIIAVASWAKVAVSFSLKLDLQTIASKIHGWNASDPSELEIIAPAIELVQNGSKVTGLEALHLQPRGGVLLEVRPR